MKITIQKRHGIWVITGQRQTLCRDFEQAMLICQVMLLEYYARWGYPFNKSVIKGKHYDY